MFRKAFAKAIDKALAEKQITSGEAAKLRTLRPMQIVRARGFCEGKLPPKAIGDGKLLAAIDWEKFIDLIIKLLPLILAIF